MKAIVKTILVAIGVNVLVLKSGAQETPAVSTPKWVSDKGYWVVETNRQSPLDHTVRFYNNFDELIYKETITGIKLNVQKRKVKMRLKQVLEQTVALTAQNQRDTTERAYLASLFR